jgi:hypothetical protein
MLKRIKFIKVVVGKYPFNYITNQTIYLVQELASKLVDEGKAIYFSESKMEASSYKNKKCICPKNKCFSGESK